MDDKVLRKLLYLAWRFSPLVEGYKSITAYHAGDGVWVEVDVIMDEKTPLEHSHDLSETLQYCLVRYAFFVRHFYLQIAHWACRKVCLKWTELSCQSITARLDREGIKLPNKFDNSKMYQYKTLKSIITRSLYSVGFRAVVEYSKCEKIGDKMDGKLADTIPHQAGLEEGGC